MKIPECEYCHDIYGSYQEHIKIPKFLECGDTICKQCLQECINKSEGEDFLCPNNTCRKKIKKKQIIEDYPTNKEIIKIINSLFNIPKSEFNESENNINKYNIITLGSSAVGKTSIFHRLINGKFIKAYETTLAINYLEYRLKYEGNKYTLVFWDTSGQEKFKSITANYLNKADGVLFVFDINNKESFDDLESWFKFYTSKKEEVIGVIIGNKNDLERKVDLKEAKEFAEKCKIQYFETSCLLDTNIKKAIIYLLNHIINSKYNYDSIPTSLANSKNTFIIDKENNKEERKSFCSKFWKYLNPKNWFK